MGFFSSPKDERKNMFDSIMKENKMNELLTHLDEDILRIEAELQKITQRHMQLQRRLIEIGKALLQNIPIQQREEMLKQKEQLEKADIKEIKESQEKLHQMQDDFSKARRIVKKESKMDKHLEKVLSSHMSFQMG